MNTGVLQDPVWFGSRAKAGDVQHTNAVNRAWNLDTFEREQIRGLVRQVFFSDSTRPVRQVVFTAPEPSMDLARVCELVGYALADETPSSIAVVCGRETERESNDFHEDNLNKNGSVLRRLGHRARTNLWFIPEGRIVQYAEQNSPVQRLEARLWELRRDFQYSIIESSSAGGQRGSAALGQLADGIILVVTAHRTRWAVANRVKQILEASHTRILGAVLSERRFPIPEKIYRCL